jgi:hypothetical protein
MNLRKKSFLKWIELAQDKIQWQILVNKVISLQQSLIKTREFLDQLRNYHVL